MTETEDQEQFRLNTERAMLGHEIDEFFHTPMGRYILNRMDDEFEQNAVQLAQVSPTDTLKLSQLQVRVLAIRLVKTWLSDAITDGLQSMRLLETIRNEHENS